MRKRKMKVNIPVPRVHGLSAIGQVPSPPLDTLIPQIFNFPLNAFSFQTSPTMSDAMSKAKYVQQRALGQEVVPKGTPGKAWNFVTGELTSIAILSDGKTIGLFARNGARVHVLENTFFVNGLTGEAINISGGPVTTTTAYSSPLLLDEQLQRYFDQIWSINHLSTGGNPVRSAVLTILRNVATQWQSSAPPGTPGRTWYFPADSIAVRAVRIAQDGRGVIVSGDTWAWQFGPTGAQTSAPPIAVATVGPSAPTPLNAPISTAQAAPVSTTQAPPVSTTQAAPISTTQAASVSTTQSVDPNAQGEPGSGGGIVGSDNLSVRADLSVWWLVAFGALLLLK
jgi:hypothetical protein